MVDFNSTGSDGGDLSFCRFDFRKIVFGWSFLLIWLGVLGGLSALVEGILHKMERFLKDEKVYLKFYQGVLKELVVLGFISMVVLLVRDFSTRVSKNQFLIIEFSHLWIFCVGLVFVMQGIQIARSLRSSKMRWDKSFALGLEAIKQEHDAWSRRRLVRFLPSPFWMTCASISSFCGGFLGFDWWDGSSKGSRLIRMARLWILRKHFIDRNNLPRSFEFAKYMRRSLSDLVLKHVNIGWQTWVVLCTIFLVSGLIVSALQLEEQKLAASSIGLISMSLSFLLIVISLVLLLCIEVGSKRLLRSLGCQRPGSFDCVFNHASRLHRQAEEEDLRRSVRRARRAESLLSNDSFQDERDHEEEACDPFHGGGYAPNDDACGCGKVVGGEPSSASSKPTRQSLSSAVKSLTAKTKSATSFRISSSSSSKSSRRSSSGSSRSSSSGTRSATGFDMIDRAPVPYVKVERDQPQKKEVDLAQTPELLGLTLDDIRLDTILRAGKMNVVRADEEIQRVIVNLSPYSENDFLPFAPAWVYMSIFRVIMLTQCYNVALSALIFFNQRGQYTLLYVLSLLIEILAHLILVVEMFPRIVRDYAILHSVCQLDSDSIQMVSSTLFYQTDTNISLYEVAVALHRAYEELGEDTENVFEHLRQVSGEKGDRIRWRAFVKGMKQEPFKFSLTGRQARRVMRSLNSNKGIGLEEVTFLINGMLRYQERELMHNDHAEACFRNAKVKCCMCHQYVSALDTADHVQSCSARISSFPIDENSLAENLVQRTRYGLMRPFIGTVSNDNDD